ncbi:MAG: DUF2851 family protein [Chloroflexi bacterium]|nr:DUF2851 family protein [Chloroflexota bacterium]
MNTVLDYRMPTAYKLRPSAFVVRESPRKYGSSKKPLGPEAILHMAWRQAGLERAHVRGRDGHLYKIVYGGKPGGSLGPDFTDAVVERDDRVVFRGDVEIHVRESDWGSHGHHTDPRYNGVVLHVIASESNGSTTLAVTKIGAAIPLLALNWKNTEPNSSLEAGPTYSCAAVGTEFIVPPVPKQLLDINTAGLERFHSQAAGIALDVEVFGADQALWLGILGALGYPRNKRAFRVVGGRVDWQTALICKTSSELEQLLLQASGFSDETTSGPIFRLPLRGSIPRWVQPWGRPANAPQLRIKAISELAAWWFTLGGIARAVEQKVLDCKNSVDLSSMLRPSGFVENDHVTVLGAARASEIVVNVLLPAAFAISTRQNVGQVGSKRIKNRALELYSSHPKLVENSITKEAKVALSIDYEIPEITTARDQQGLITLYREMYRHGIQARQPRLPGVQSTVCKTRL